MVTKKKVASQYTSTVDPGGGSVHPLRRSQSEALCGSPPSRAFRATWPIGLPALHSCVGDPARAISIPNSQATELIAAQRASRSQSGTSRLHIQENELAIQTSHKSDRQLSHNALERGALRLHSVPLVTTSAQGSPFGLARRSAGLLRRRVSSQLISGLDLKRATILDVSSPEVLYC